MRKSKDTAKVRQVVEHPARFAFYYFSIRILMYLTATPGRLVSTLEVADAYGISIAYLQKAVLGLTRLGYIDTVAGRKGGLRLARSPQMIRLGNVVANVEGVGDLNETTLSDIVGSPTGEAIREMVVQQQSFTRPQNVTT